MNRLTMATINDDGEQEDLLGYPLPPELASPPTGELGLIDHLQPQQLLATLQAKIEKLVAEKAQQEGELQVAARWIAKLEQEISDLIAENRALQACKQELVNLVAQVDHLTKLYFDLKADNQQLQKKLESCQQIQSEEIALLPSTRFSTPTAAGTESNRLELILRMQRWQIESLHKDILERDKLIEELNEALVNTVAQSKRVEEPTDSIITPPAEVSKLEATLFSPAFSDDDDAVPDSDLVSPSPTQIRASRSTSFSTAEEGPPQADRKKSITMTLTTLTIRNKKKTKKNNNNNTEKRHTAPEGGGLAAAVAAADVVAKLTVHRVQ